MNQFFRTMFLGIAAATFWRAVTVDRSPTVAPHRVNTEWEIALAKESDNAAGDLPPADAPSADAAAAGRIWLAESEAELFQLRDADEPAEEPLLAFDEQPYEFGSPGDDSNPAHWIVDSGERSDLPRFESVAEPAGEPSPTRASAENAPAPETGLTGDAGVGSAHAQWFAKPDPADPNAPRGPLPFGHGRMWSLHQAGQQAAASQDRTDTSSEGGAAASELSYEPPPVRMLSDGPPKIDIDQVPGGNPSVPPHAVPARPPAPPDTVQPQRQTDISAGYSYAPSLRSQPISLAVCQTDVLERVQLRG